MNKCLNCGKEIPEGRKFCSSSCSAKYNNVRRQRHPWTEEQRKKVRKPGNETYRCKHCGTVLERGQVCPECSGYNKPTVYRQLHLTEGPLKFRFEKAKKLIQDWYFQDKMSIPEIREKTGLHFGTIRFFLTVDGEETRGKKEGQRNAIEQGRWEHHSENPHFKSGTHTSWEGKKFHFRSSWEEEYMKQLDSQKVSYLYEPFSIRYFDTRRNEERIAIPDFFFPETNTVLELKSNWTYDEQNMKDRFKSYREKGYKVKLLLNWEEVEV